MTNQKCNKTKRITNDMKINIKVLIKNSAEGFGMPNEKRPHNSE